MYEYLRAKQKPAIFLGQNKIYAVTAQCETCDISADTFRVTFKPGNPYYTMDEGNNYYQQFPDRLAIIPINGGGIVSGAQQVTIVGKVRIENGANTPYFDNGEFSIKTATDATTNYDTVPLYLWLYDNNFKNPLEGMKDKDGIELKNTIEINENNLIRYNSAVHISSVVDPAHIVSESESGLEVMRILNTYQNFAIIIQAPYDATKPDEKPYFEESTELLVLNTQKEQKPLVLKMENAQDLISEDQQKRLETHKKFLEELNQKQKRLQKEKQPFDFYVIGHSKLDIVQEGNIQIRIADGHFKDKDGKTKTDTVQLDYQTGIIGSSLGEVKLQKLKEETAKELIKEGVLTGEDYYKDKRLLIFKETGQRKAQQRLKQKISIDQEIQGQLYKIDYEEGEIKMTIHPTRAPIFTAIQLIKKKYPELKEKSASEVLTSPQMQQIEFPSCSYLRLVSELAKRTTGKMISYKCKSH